MKSPSSSSATLKFASPEINVGLEAAKGEMPVADKPVKQPKMPTGGKTPKMPKDTMVIVAQAKRKRMPKRNKM
jgi:hypothetical protein